MNVITRGVKNALRNPIRSGAIVAILAVSIALIMAMLVARTSVNQKINEIKSTSATTITVRPAGIMGGMGGGDPLAAEQVATIRSTPHVSSVTATLTDQLGTNDTNLTSSLELGSFGRRMQRFESASGTAPEPITVQRDIAERTPPQPRTTITGTTNPEVAADSTTLKLTSGSMIDGKSDHLEAMVGKTLANKNSLTPGSTFTAYGKTFTVKGIFETGSVFQDSSLIVPLAALQNTTNQAGAVTSVNLKTDSIDNVAKTVSTLKSTLGDKADITSQQEQAKASVSSLESIAALTTNGVIGATIAASVIILLSMMLIVRERKREIGVLKAIGGTTTKVITQFMTEAMTLTIVGGVVGIGLGVLVSGTITNSLVKGNETTPHLSLAGPSGGDRPVRVMGGPGIHLEQTVRNVTSTITPEAFIITSSSLLLIALIGSAVPAWMIARVRPAEVLRSE